MTEKLIPDEAHLSGLICKKCQSQILHLTEQTFKNGTNHLKATCAVCTEFVAFVRQFNPEAAGKAGAWVFPFGKHKGKSLSELFTIEPGYIAWAAENMTARAKDECRAFLDYIDGNKGTESTSSALISNTVGLSGALKTSVVPKLPTPMVLPLVAKSAR